MKRRVLKIGLVVLAGEIVNVPVACGIAMLFEPPQNGPLYFLSRPLPPPFTMQTTSDQEGFWRVQIVRFTGSMFAWSFRAQGGYIPDHSIDNQVIDLPLC